MQVVIGITPRNVREILKISKINNKIFNFENNYEREHTQTS